MNAFTGSPRLLKGAITSVEPLNLLASMAVVQYNPDTITRSFAIENVSAQDRRGDRPEILRLKGRQDETIRLDRAIAGTTFRGGAHFVAPCSLAPRGTNP
jgi:hypothetical protein